MLRVLANLCWPKWRGPTKSILAPVVKKMANVVHWINLYSQLDSAILVSLTLIDWTKICYPAFV